MTDIFTCPHCGANLTKVGIIEKKVHGESSAEIFFDETKVMYLPSAIANFDEWLVCKKCHGEIRDRTADEIMHAFKERVKVKS